MVLAPANLLQIALIAVAFVGVVLTFDRPRLRAVTGLLVMAAVWMGFNLLEEAAGFRRIWLVTPAFRLLYPAIFYLLVRSLVYSGASLRLKDWPHGVPFLVALAVTPYGLDLVEHAARISLVVYAAASIWLVHRFNTLSRDRRSDAQTIQLRGIYVLIAAYLIDTVYDVLRMDAGWLHESWPWLASQQAYIAQLAYSLVTTLVLIYIAVRRASMFDGVEPGSLVPDKPVEADTFSGDFQRIERAVREEALYSEPRLTRAELARAAGVPERRVSLAIREATGRNFNDYINRLRVEDVEAMMREDRARGERRRLLDLAYTAGFSSKSVFNDVFRREFGTTPTQYMDTLD